MLFKVDLAARDIIERRNKSKAEAGKRTAPKKRGRDK